MDYRATAILGSLLVTCSTCLVAAGQERKVDLDRVKAAGIRRVEGQRLTLYTDMPPAEEIDELPALFAAAYPQWCRYFDLPENTDPPWRMTAYLMKEQARFEASGLWDERLPDFPSGYCLDHECWCRVHPTPYYRRHLLLHEGTHGFMLTRLGSTGPTWHAEGLAELLGTHSWRDGQLTIGYFPKSREEADGWGRSRVIRDAFKKGEAWSLAKVFALDRTGEENEGYSWCWAAAALLDGHPDYRQRFRGMQQQLRQPDFQQRLLAAFQADQRELVENWQLFISEMQYGYDITRAAVQHGDAEQLPAGGATVVVQADRAWQSSGLELKQGEKYQLIASGRFMVAKTTKDWFAEPGGVSVRYYRGFPLGRLLAAIRPNELPSGAGSPLLDPIDVGLGAVIEPMEDGVLYLRLNDSPAELAENEGQVRVEVVKSLAE